jgi:hypothetical protein
MLKRHTYIALSSQLHLKGRNHLQGNFLDLLKPALLSAISAMTEKKLKKAKVPLFPPSYLIPPCVAEEGEGGGGRGEKYSNLQWPSQRLFSYTDTKALVSFPLKLQLIVFSKITGAFCFKHLVDFSTYLLHRFIASLAP